MTVQKRQQQESFSIEDLPEHLRVEMEQALANEGWSPNEVTMTDQPKEQIEAATIPAPDLADYRMEILGKAAHIVTRDRNTEYGEPEDTFEVIAHLWNAYLGDENLLTTDVANMLMLLKIARLRANPGHEDSWIDVAGYAACGASNARVLIERQE